MTGFTVYRKQTVTKVITALIIARKLAHTAWAKALRFITDFRILRLTLHT